MAADVNVIGRIVEAIDEFEGDEIKAVCLKIKQSSAARFVSGSGEGVYQYFLNGSKISAARAGVTQSHNPLGLAFRQLRNLARREYIREFVL